ncbi:MAG: glutaminase, partial [Arenimonas sp.]|nr:glutaminase [Arenimonas sp.]
MHPRLHVEDEGDFLRVSTGSLPDLELVSAAASEAYALYGDNNGGVVADYIPALARVSPELFGISVVGVGGAEFGVGDCDHHFSIQSISKPFVFALVCQAIGAEVARARIGVNATGLPFNSVMAIELNGDR